MTRLFTPEPAAIAVGMPIAEHPPAQIPAGVIHALGSHFG